MADHPELQSEIIAAINAKVGSLPHCAFCGQRHWEVQRGLVSLVMAEDALTPFGEGPVRFVHAALHCGGCGNTVLLNVAGLGLLHLLPGDERTI
jgi:hypothetical protein